MATFNEILDHFGGVSGLARTLGCAPQAVSMWKRKVPAVRAFQIEVLSGGRFKVDELPMRKDQRAKLGISRASSAPTAASA